MVGQPAVIVAGSEPHMVIRVLWFLFVGWWLSFLVLWLAWIANVTIIGLPLGVWLMNRIPQAATLKSSRSLTVTVDASGATVATYGDRDQRPFWQRALFFALVGWWFSLLWLNAAWLLSVLIITLPLGFWMFGAAGKVTTLRR